MKTLQCDIKLGGSTKQYLDYQRRNETYEQAVKNITKALVYKCKTVPATYGTRTAALIGLVYDQFGGDEYLLDMVIDAIHAANKILRS